MPHVTLADGSPPERIAACLAALAGYTASVTIGRVHLLEEGSDRVWRPLADAALGPAIIVGRGGLPVELAVTETLDPEARRFFAAAWREHLVASYGPEAEPAVPFAVTARREGEVVGVALGDTADDVRLERLVVAPTARGQGIGSRLLAAVAQLGAERGCQRVVLVVQAGGPAEGFYRSRGWQPGTFLPQWRRAAAFRPHDAPARGVVARLAAPALGRSTHPASLVALLFRGGRSPRYHRLSSRGSPRPAHCAHTHRPRSGGVLNTMPELDALVVDARLRQSLVAVRCIGRLGRRVGVADSPGSPPPASRSRWTAMSATLPDVADGADTYIDALLQLLERHPTRVLISTHDGTIDAIRARRAELERVVGVALAPERSLGPALDKGATLAAAAVLGVDVPRGGPAVDPSDVRDLLEEVGLPAVVKPVHSWFPGDGAGRRMTACDVLTVAEGLVAVARIVDAGGQALVQQFLPGRKEAVSLFRADDRVIAEFAQVALRTDPALGGSSVVRRSIAMPADAASAARSLLDYLDLDGYSEVEFRRDANGRAVLMEINPRLSASIEIAVRSGVDFPSLAYAWAAGEELRPSPGYRVGVRMRWLGGDFSWLEETLRQPGRPDVPSAVRSVPVFVSDFLRPARYDYLDLSDPRPAWVAATAAVRRLGRRAAKRRVETPSARGELPVTSSSTTRSPRAGRSPSPGCDVAVVGAGPYGLSIAAHAGAKGLDVRVLGRPMAFWQEHMPDDMYLKSEGFASNLSDPNGQFTLARFCRESSEPYGDYGYPVKRSTFVDYALWFQKRAEVDVESCHVTHVEALVDRPGFRLRRDDGGELTCRSVVVAPGCGSFAFLPPVLRSLPTELVSHSVDHAGFQRFEGRRVAVIGGGQSSLESAALLADAGAEPILVVRDRRVRWNADPPAEPRSLVRRLRGPRSGLGDAWDGLFYQRAPNIFHHLPERRRLLAVSTVAGPAGAWWLRPRVVDRLPMLTGWTVVSAQAEGEGARLTLADGTGAEQLLYVDHVIAATGFVPDVGALPFLSPGLVAGVRRVGATASPALSGTLESSVPGLHFAGLLTAAEFGPAMRFVLGTGFTARRLVASWTGRRTAPASGAVSTS